MKGYPAACEADGKLYVPAALICDSFIRRGGVLRKLVEDGELRREGKGKNTCYSGTK